MYRFLISNDHVAQDLAFGISHELHDLVSAHAPELKQDFPSFTSFEFEVGVDDTICVATIRFRDHGIPAGGRMEASKFSELKGVVGSARRYAILRQIPALSGYFGWDRLLLAADVIDGSFGWDEITAELVAWVNDIPLPRAVHVNEKRVRRALPEPPQYSLSKVQGAMWVLECDQSCKQGTAFDLMGYGAITCSHVVDETTNLMAFRAHEVTRKFPVEVVRQHRVLDLAVLRIAGSDTAVGLTRSEKELTQMDHIGVCGFPNYRFGDSVSFTPGIVTGTRPRSGIRRLLTNAPIVRGMSGGPAIIADTAVAGVCVTGSDSMQTSRETEDHSIIPIAALDLLD